MNSILKKITALSIYAVAMALVEAAVVVYLRELYYPLGFFIRSAADLEVIPLHILNVELWREAATIFMLAAVSYLAFSAAKYRLLAFIFAFSLWDLAYYLFLYLFLRWPPGLMTLDVYFLIPWPWIGPVWLPLILFSFSAITSFWFMLKTKNEQ
ncbi:MAG: hypothetical protein WAP51_04130 [Candidatus Sungiibacteriota bacterium]